MRKDFRLVSFIVFLAFLIVSASLISGCSSAEKTKNEEAGLDEKKKEELDMTAYFAAKCGFCHELDRIEKYQKKDWDNILKRMYQYDNGANLTKDDYPLLLDYLKKTFK